MIKIFLFSMILGTYIWQNSENNLYKAEIVREVGSNEIRVRGDFQNKTSNNLDLEYKLLVVRKGSAGSSRNIQSGAFKALPNSNTTLSKSVLNINKNDNVVVELYVTKNTKTIAEDILEISF
jgi:hypothetical protein